MRALKLKITKFGNSAALLLPKEALAKLHAERGDTVCLTETVEGSRIVPYDPDCERQVEIVQKVAKKRRKVLGKLAE
jgi:putative addiction module antidote